MRQILWPDMKPAGGWLYSVELCCFSLCCVVLWQQTANNNNNKWPYWSVIWPLFNELKLYYNIT